MSESDVRVDILFNSIKLLQKEKSGLELKLRELRQTRSKYENTLSKLQSRNKQLGDINSQMQETLKVAQHKVSLTQSQMENLQQTVHQKRSSVDKLNDTIEEHKQHEIKNVQAFEEQLASLADNFKNATMFYHNDNLKAKVRESEEKTVRCLDECTQMQSKLEDFQRQTESLASERENILENARKLGLDVQQQEQCLEIFEDELCRARSQKEEIEQKLKAAEAQLEE